MASRLGYDWSDYVPISGSPTLERNSSRVHVGIYSATRAVDGEVGR